MDTNQQSQTTSSQSSSKGPNVVLIIVVVILILLIIGGGTSWYIYYRIKKAAQKLTETVPTNNSGTPSSEAGKLPSADVAGSDLTNVPRYPNSIRSYYYQNADINLVQVNYKVKATADEILAYYKKQMPALGWTLVISDEKSLTYNNSGQVTINVGETVNSITEYHLEFFAQISE